MKFRKLENKFVVLFSPIEFQDLLSNLPILIDILSRNFDSAINDLDNTKIPSSYEFKSKPGGWETTTKAQDGDIWEMSQREGDTLPRI